MKMTYFCQRTASSPSEFRHDHRHQQQRSCLHRLPRAGRRPSAARRTAYEKRVAAGFPDRVTPDLAAFLAEQDQAFLATASAAGAPYIQHRGGPKGFIKVLDERTLGFADYAGNRQYITIGNLSENDRAHLFLLDHGSRRRIKIWGRARVVEDDPALIERLFDLGYRARPQRAILFSIEAWDVNCQAHITARFTEAEIAEATGCCGSGSPRSKQRTRGCARRSISRRTTTDRPPAAAMGCRRTGEKSRL